MISRRKFTAAFKAQVVLELLSGTKTSAELGREHQIAASVLADWKAIFLRHAPEAFESPKHHNGQEATRVAELERLVGRWTLENDILTKATSILHQRPRSNTRESRCSAIDILCARYVVCWATRAAIITSGLAPVLSRHFQRRSSAWRESGRPMATDASQPSCDARISR
jgi:transposase